MAGADLRPLAIDPQQRAAIELSIDEAFVSGFRLVMFGAAILALAAAGFGAGIKGRP
jgi:hypothetical protein